MILEFPGTRGEIEESSRSHKYHSSLIVSYKNTRILIDYGEKHSPALEKTIHTFDGLFITHAHPDHYIWTLKDEPSIKIPVYLTRTTYDYSTHKPANPEIIEEGKEMDLKDLRITPLKVIHSFRCPAVCYRVEGGKNIIYAPDLIDIKSGKEKAFINLDCLVADGSSLYTNMVRNRDGVLFGHTRIKTVINWCKEYKIEKLFITHCGKQVVTMDKKDLDKKIEQYSGGAVKVTVAYDGFRTRL
jgi:ribonuclease BN (tRNA processing enzyme)